MESKSHGLLDQWLSQISTLYQASLEDFANMSAVERLDQMCELNVLLNYENVLHSTIVKQAQRRGQKLTIHAWIYNLHDGIVKPLEMAEVNLA
jgi:carbonic anhydrase